MFEIRNTATSGFDRAIIAMRRENGGREVSDSEWKEVHGLFDMTGIREFVIGEQDKAECIRLIKEGDCDFMKFIAVWAHIEADARWWAVYCGYFTAASVVVRRGDRVTKSVMTTYAGMRNLLEVMRESAGENEEYLKIWAELCDKIEDLPESWMLLSGLEG